MKISVASRPDYSTLFSGLNTSRNSSAPNSLNDLIGSGMLSDYKSIKSGSYGKLMKAYYTKDGASKEVSAIADDKKNSTKTKVDVKSLNDVKTSASALKDSADKLVSSEFKDMDETLSSVKSFVKNYNSLIDKTGELGSKNINNRTDNLKKLTESSKEDLKAIGISIDKDNKLTLDTDIFKKSDLSRVQDVFGGIGSYGYSASAQASIVDYQAGYESLKLNTYTSSGFVDGSATSVGTLLNNMV